MRGISHQVLELREYCAKLYLRVGLNLVTIIFPLIKDLSLPVWGSTKCTKYFFKGNPFPHCVEKNNLSASKFW